MLIPRRAKTFAVGFALLSVVLTAVATLMVIAQSGYASASRVYAAFVYIAFWPALLLHLDRDHLFVAVVPFLVNCLGWAAIGFAFGFLFRKSGRDATPTKYER